jgi:hypothetical protein
MRTKQRKPPEMDVDGDSFLVSEFHLRSAELEIKDMKMH